MHRDLLKCPDCGETHTLAVNPNRNIDGLDFYCKECKVVFNREKPVFVTKDSGERAEFITGARRDTEAGKPRYDLISPIALKRLAELMGRGAEKYGDRNWEKGIPLNRFYSSALRHLFQWASGDKEEDHLSAVLFNVMGIIHTSEKIESGQLPPELDDFDR